MTSGAEINDVVFEKIDFVSDNALIKGRVSMDALMDTKRLIANMSADVDHVDLYRMQVVGAPLTLGLCGSFDVNSDMKLNHYLSGLISDITVRDSVKSRRTEFIGIHARTDRDTTLLRAQSGDFIVKYTKEAMEEAIMPIFKGKVKILLSTMKDADAAVLGASALAWQ